MKTQLQMLLLVVLLGACSKVGDQPNDAKPIDTGNGGEAPNVPPPPQLGAQIDRMGRPVINTALVALLTTSAADVTTMKDAYNQASNPATWKTTTLIGNTTIEAEFMKNLAILDVVDNGLAGSTGCGNQLLYNGMAAGGGAPTANSYKTLADILVDDQLYIDTGKVACTKYLNLEIDVATGGTVKHTDCGGRAPTNDVGDSSYSVLLAGLVGFSTDGKLTPLVTDKVALHADLVDTQFPFLGPPTNP